LEGKEGTSGKTYNGPRFWFQFAICLSTGTSAVFAVVSALDTVTKSFLFRKKYFLMVGTLVARRTKQKIKNYRGIKELYEPVTRTRTSTRCSDSPSDCLPCDLAIRDFRDFRVLFQDGSRPISQLKEGIDVPSSWALGCRGTWAGVMGHY
jgi:hypothetical protein